MIDPAPQRTPRVALAHDWLCGWRGGEAVLDAIARALAPHAAITAIYTMFDNRRPLSPTIDSLPHVVSPLARAPSGLRRTLLPLYPLGVASLARALIRDHHRRPIDLLVSTSSAAIKSLRAPEGVPHLCYCHAPARYIWSVRDEYAAAGGPAARARDLALTLASPPFRAWDRRTANRVSRFLANSAHTRAEIRRCFGHDATVVHPPVRTGFYTPDTATEREGFWLLAGALEPYKRADLAIEAARRAGTELVVAGTGSMEHRLRLAHRGVRFLGRVSDEALRDLYRRARLLVHPQVEDFGIVCVEAQACGCPVVARARGGALDTVVPGVTGACFHEPNPDAIVHAAAGCPANPRACRENAERFSEEAFARAIVDIVNDLLRAPDARAQGASL